MGKSKEIWWSVLYFPAFSRIMNAVQATEQRRMSRVLGGGVAWVCKRSTPPSAFPPWAVTSQEQPVLVPADWQRERGRERHTENDKKREKCVWERGREREGENKSHQFHLSDSHTGYYYHYNCFSLYFLHRLFFAHISSSSPRLDSPGSNPLPPLHGTTDIHIFICFHFIFNLSTLRNKTTGPDRDPSEDRLARLSVSGCFRRMN